MSNLNTVASTSMGAALTAAGDSSAVAILPNSDNTKAYAISIVASAVTSGATFSVRVMTPGGVYVPTADFAITADGTYSVPVRFHGVPCIDSNALVKLVCVARTDGSFTATLSTMTKV